VIFKFFFSLFNFKNCLLNELLDAVLALPKLPINSLPNVQSNPALLLLCKTRIHPQWFFFKLVSLSLGILAEAWRSKHCHIARQKAPAVSFQSCSVLLTHLTWKSWLLIGQKLSCFGKDKGILCGRALCFAVEQSRWLRHYWRLL